LPINWRASRPGLPSSTLDLPKLREHAWTRSLWRSEKKNVYRREDAGETNLNFEALRACWTNPYTQSVLLKIALK